MPGPMLHVHTVTMKDTQTLSVLPSKPRWQGSLGAEDGRGGKEVPGKGIG